LISPLNNKTANNFESFPKNFSNANITIKNENNNNNNGIINKDSTLKNINFNDTEKKIVKNEVEKKIFNNTLPSTNINMNIPSPSFKNIHNTLNYTINNNNDNVNEIIINDNNFIEPDNKNKNYFDSNNIEYLEQFNSNSTLNYIKILKNNIDKLNEENKNLNSNYEGFLKEYEKIINENDNLKIYINILKKNQNLRNEKILNKNIAYDKNNKKNINKNLLEKENENKNNLGLNFLNDNYNGSYDIIIDIKSIANLNNEGWEINYSNREFYNSKKDCPTITIGVIGNGNKGKSFFLQKLSEYNIPKGFNVKTKGLSIRYAVKEDHNLTILDSAGQETPLLNNNNEIDNEYLLRDKLNTELFIQKFIILKSKILFIVVGNITLSEQKLITRIKKEGKNKQIFIIHNLQIFQTKEQVEDYIENT
jgi:hypothetical protein